MSQAPFYVSPEQLMKDRADFARKGIARGRSVVVLRYDEGILLLAENPSPTLHKIARDLRPHRLRRSRQVQRVRDDAPSRCEVRGPARIFYHRSDVTARGLTNAYAQTLAGVFTTESKPFEVELVVAELGLTAETDQLYRLSYDGSVMDETEHVAIGGRADDITATLKDLSTSVLPLREVFDHGVRALASAASGTLPTQDLEAAVLDRNASGHRTFKRLSDAMMAQLRED
ncbi:proteasome subunit alpha [Brevibacterium sp. UCMA 11754]|uniref:proteasome subunit alpha n=1 Tax=Brevibacterium sp. UCMA 11754 TaxID=2749198 RepID=UPI001F1AFB7E|nr:proteasome subunit alpha [Brevibacterium sp. UCMA 11754]